MKAFMKFLNKLYRNKALTGGILLLIALISGIIGNCILLENQELSNKIWKSFVVTVGYLGLNVPEFDKINLFTGISYVLVVFVMFLGAIIAIFRKNFDNFYTKNLIKNKNIVLFGFGETNQTFLRDFSSKNRDESIIVIDKEDKEFDEYWEKGYAFLKRDINDNLSFDFEETMDIIVSLGGDRINVDFGIRLIEILKDINSETKLSIQCNDSDLNELFFSKLKEIQDKNSNIKINVKLFSFYSEIVDEFFDKYHKQLVPMEYAMLNTNKKELKLIIVGNSKLSQEIIKRIFITFIFPNNVKTKIILIDKKVDEFIDEIKFITNCSADKFSHIVLESKELNYTLLQNKEFWNQKDLIDVIISYEDENKNLELAIDLYRKVYIFDNNRHPNLYFAMFNELHLSEEINKNEALFKRFFTFGNKSEILNVDNLLEEKQLLIAKQIHNGYGTKFDKNILNLDKEKLNKKWFSSTKYSDKLSNIAQYIHLDFKLLSLGLYREESDKSNKELLKINQKIFYSKLKDILPFSEEEIIKFSNEVEKSYSEDYDTKIADDFWQKFIANEKFYKLIDTEHKRWNSYHFLHGWEYSDTKDKDKKLHNCLVDLNDFDDRDRQMTILYDMYAFLYIPNYLASAGYEIKEK